MSAQKLTLWADECVDVEGIFGTYGDAYQDTLPS